MTFSPSSTLSGLWTIDLNRREDDRGWLARTYCETEFQSHGLNTRWPQCNLTRTLQRGMLRGMHFQAEPVPEIKLVRCVAGAIFDVVVDIRPGSPTFGRSESFELSAENGRSLYIPAGFAHGFQCLTDDCHVHYQMSEFYRPERARGFRWNDEQIQITWPVTKATVSDKDANLPVFSKLITGI